MNRSAPPASRRSVPAILLMIGLAAGLPGCSGDTVGPESVERVVVYANLYVGQPVDGESAVLVSRTRPIFESYDPDEAAVRDAVVFLRPSGAANAETLAMDTPGHYTSSDFRIEAGTTYHLRVEVPGHEPITATTTTPDSLVFHREPAVRPTIMRHSVIPDSFPIVISCPNPDQVLLVDVFCREAWPDARYLEPFGDHDRPDDYREYGGDNGEPRHIFGYMRYKDLETAEADQRRVNFYDAMMVFLGRYTVTVASIDDNTYQSLYRDHPEENGGIHGGIGLFGSADRRAFEVEIVK